MTEQWKECLEGFYEVSDLGRVRRAKPGRGTQVGKILKPRPQKSGYVQVGPWIRGIQKSSYIHKLVAVAFLGPCPEDKEVNHSNGDKHNNAVTNLEYVTHLDNSHHAFRNGFRKCKFSKDTIERVKSLRNEGKKLREIKALTGVSEAMCHNIITGKMRQREW